MPGLTDQIRSEILKDEIRSNIEGISTPDTFATTPEPASTLGRPYSTGQLPSKMLSQWISEKTTIGKPGQKRRGLFDPLPNPQDDPAITAANLAKAIPQLMVDMPQFLIEQLPEAMAGSIGFGSLPEAEQPTIGKMGKQMTRDLAATIAATALRQLNPEEYARWKQTPEGQEVTRMIAEEPIRPLMLPLIFSGLMERGAKLTKGRGAGIKPIEKPVEAIAEIPPVEKPTVIKGPSPKVTKAGVGKPEPLGAEALRAKRAIEGKAPKPKVSEGKEAVKDMRTFKPKPEDIEFPYESIEDVIVAESDLNIKRLAEKSLDRIPKEMNVIIREAAQSTEPKQIASVLNRPFKQVEKGLLEVAQGKDVSKTAQMLRKQIIDELAYGRQEQFYDRMPKGAPKASRWKTDRTDVGDPRFQKLLVDNGVVNKDYFKEAFASQRGAVINPFQEIASKTTEMIEKAKAPPEVTVGVKQAKKAMIEHDRQIRSAEFTSKEMERVFKVNIAKDRQMNLVHAYEHKMKGKHWDELSSLEKKIVEWARDEKAKLNRFIKDNDVLEMMPEQKGINHIFHHWIDPKTGRPYEAMYSKFSKGLPQAKQRTIPTYEAGMESGMKPATTNLGKLIGLEWESVMRAHQSRQMFKTLHNIGAEKGMDIQLRTGKPAKPIRMVENWKQLQDQGLTDSYTRYDHWALDKAMTFKSGDRLVTIKGPVGVRNELFPFVKAYLESPNYKTLDNLNFATKSLKLGMSMFHVVSLGAQEIANWRIPFKNIPRGLKAIKEVDPELRLLYEEGFDPWKGYEDLGYRNKFFEGSNILSKSGNVISFPLQAMRSFIFDYIQPGMKTSFALDKFHKGLPKALKEGLTKRQWAAEVREMADGHFSHEHWKRSLLETNRFMTKLYFMPEARKWWQRTLLSPTWQREHLLVAKNVSKSFMPDKFIKKLGMKDISKTAKAEYRKYALGAITMIGAVDLYNLFSTQYMDGEAKHIWQNPEGKGFGVRALWNEPSYTVEREDGTTRTVPGGPAYVRPLKSIYEVAEWIGDPIQKFKYKLSPVVTAIGNQLFPSKYRKEYEGITDIPRRIWDFILDVGTPIQADQVARWVKGKKSLPSMVTPFVGMPSSKLKAKDTRTQYYERMARAVLAGRTDEYKKIRKEFEGFGFKFDNKKYNEALNKIRR